MNPDRASHPKRKVDRVSFSQSMTINPGPMVGTESRPVPGMTDVRRKSAFGDRQDLIGHIRKTESGRYTGVLPGASGGVPKDTPAFNVRTEARARAAASALGNMPTSQAVSRGERMRLAFGRRAAAGKA